MPHIRQVEPRHRLVRGNKKSAARPTAERPGLHRPVKVSEGAKVTVRSAHVHNASARTALTAPQRERERERVLSVLAATGSGGRRKKPFVGKTEAEDNT